MLWMDRQITFSQLLFAGVLSLNCLYTRTPQSVPFIVSLNKADLSHRKSASAVTSRDTGRAKGIDKRDTLCFTCLQPFNILTNEINLHNTLL